MKNEHSPEVDFSWSRAIEEAEEGLQGLSEAVQTGSLFCRVTNKDDSWLSLIDEAENYRRNTTDQKTKGIHRKKERAGAIIGGMAVIACVAAIGFVGAVALNRGVDEESVVSSAVIESNKGSTIGTVEEAETMTSTESNRLTAEYQKEIAAGVAARKAEKERKKATNSSSNSREKSKVPSDNSVQETAENLPSIDNAAAETETGSDEQTTSTVSEGTEGITSEENSQGSANTTDTYLEATYNSYAAQIQSESASLISQLQEGAIDYMTASQQLSSLYSVGNQAIFNYWMNGNCTYADMMTWSNKLWNVYTAESPKLVGAGQ